MNSITIYIDSGIIFCRSCHLLNGVFCNGFQKYCEVGESRLPIRLLECRLQEA